MRRLALCLASVLFTVSLAACGGDDGDDATTTTEAPADGSPTTPGDDAPALGALDNFVISWNSTNTIAGNQVGDRFVATPVKKGEVTTGPSDDGGDLFVVRLNAGAILGGRIDAEGNLSSTWVGVDPDNEAAASVVQTALMRHIQDDESGLPVVAPIYREVALSAEVTSRFVTAGDDDSFVIALIEGAEAGDRLMSVSMSKLTDEDAARQRAAADQTELLTLLGG